MIIFRKQKEEVDRVYQVLLSHVYIIDHRLGTERFIAGFITPLTTLELSSFNSKSKVLISIITNSPHSS
jgi:hypothetical protein